MVLSVLAICGSTRAQSTNHLLINAIAALYKDTLNIQTFTGLATLPHFNPDIEGDDIESVQSFRKRLSEADGILICTPEYAHGVPGTLKNAIDWTVGSNEFYNKPTVLITASTEGNYGHTALLETLKAINTKNIEQLNLLISFVKTKVNATGIKDETTLAAVNDLIEKFIETMHSATAEEDA